MPDYYSPMRLFTPVYFDPIIADSKKAEDIFYDQLSFLEEMEYHVKVLRKAVENGDNPLSKIALYDLDIIDKKLKALTVIAENIQCQK